ncbi:MAG: amidohydrolase family protein [Alphaproteobacteria bacterium]|nr:amidohydrolase family protein [Alphaproteobacteria bacterium]
MDLKFLHATVLTQNDNRELLEDGGVAVKGGRIAAVGRSTEIERAHAALPTIDLSGKALIPGLINAHTHVLLLALRGTVEDMGAEAIYGYMSPISFAMEDDMRRALALLGVAEALRSGTSTLVEPFRHVVNYAGAMARTGMRLWFAENCADALTLKIRHGIYEFDRAWGETFLERERALIEKFHGTHGGRVHCQVAGHAPDNCSPWMLRQLNDLKEKHGLRRTVHMAQSKGEVAQVRKYAGCTPAQYLERHDWLGADVVGAHWTWCTDGDVALLARRGVHMAHCAANSSRRGPHTAPVAKILDAGVNVCLGTDNMTEDMLQAMKIGSIVHRGGYGGGVNPPPQHALDAATRNGALSLGAEADIGSIEPGKKADLAVLNLRDACMVPRINLVSNLVHYGHQGMVESVMVDGEFLMRDGRILCLDEPEVLRNAQEATAGAWRRLHEKNPDLPLPATLRRQP